MRVVFDIETNGFIDHTSVDYTASPFKLLPTFKVHCIVAKDIDTGKVYEFVQEECYTKFPEWSKQLTMLIGHNIINFDLLALKLALGLDYTLRDVGSPDMFDGRDITICDTLIVSKTLNPDRYGGHSIDAWGKSLGLPKIDWREKAIEVGLIDDKAPDGAEFATYHPEMLVYNIRDVEVNHKVYQALMKEQGDWAWEGPIRLEQRVADIITRQQHRGFWFDKDLAEACVRDLDIKMEAIRSVVEPILPPRPLPKTKQKDFTPPEKQFLKSGLPNAHIKNFIEKHNGTLEERESGWVATLFGKEHTLPIEHKPLIDSEPAKLSSSAGDSAHLKGWLVSEFGWSPSQYKERDLTCDSKKNKLTQEKFEAAVERYVEQTLSSPFCQDRCDELETSPAYLRTKLMKHDIKRPLKVYTNPTLTVGQEKEIDPKLLELAEQFPYAKDVSEYFTYTHRRNSILGGGVDPDDEEEEPEKGFLSEARLDLDHRIPTPADTCGAGTGRMKHRRVANISRVTSLYGDKMRSMFGVDVKDGFIQMAFDFDSLEAKIETHYVYKYPGGPEYGVSLTANKPFDCHSMLAASISELLGRTFPRGTAKNVKYGCLPVDSTEVLTPSGWKKGTDIKEGDKVISFKGDSLVDDTVVATWFYSGAEVYKFGNTRWNIECTEDHRWLGLKNIRAEEDSFFTARDAKTDGMVRTSAPYVGGNGKVLPHEAALVAWLLSDGYYKWSEKEEGRSSSGGTKKGVVANIAQASHKYQKELKAVLELNEMDWKETDLGSLNDNVNISYRLKATQVRSFLDRVVGCRKQKHEVDWVNWILTLPKESLKSFLYAFWLADGNTCKLTQMVIKQNRGNIADAVMLAGFLLGYKVSQAGEKCTTLNMNPEPYIGLQTSELKLNRVADVFCLTTCNGSFVIRQGGLITLTGNCSYNAQPKRVAKTVGCDVNTGTIIFDAFWTQAYPLKQLKENMQKYWETVGQKRFLLGLDGRKLSVRSKGNVINTAFQSGGVICAKRAMVIHEDLLIKEDLMVDFFKDDWKNKNFCQQLMAYHDEAQYEVRRSAVTWKTFPVKDWENEEEVAAAESAAKKFKEDNPNWSDVQHTDKMFYLGYNRAGELAVQAVTQAGQYYKLNVELTAGYMLGTNWAQCH